MSEDIFPGVRHCVAKSLDIDESEVHLDSRIIEDLGADSLDLLDLLFHLETHFKVRIKPRSIERMARASLGGVDLDLNGVYTPQAVEALRRLLPEIPAEELPLGLRTADLPRRFRVATFVTLVQKALAGEVPNE